MALLIALLEWHQVVIADVVRVPFVVLLEDAVNHLLGNCSYLVLGMKVDCLLSVVEGYLPHLRIVFTR